MDKADISLCVSIGSLIISLLGLGISFFTRSTKKKVMISYSATRGYTDRNSSKLEVTVNNNGNRTVTINKLGIGVYKKEFPYLLPKRHYLLPFVDDDKKPSGYDASETINVEKAVDPHHTIKVTYPFYNYEYYQKKYKKIYVFAEDADGKSYKGLVDIRLS